MTKVFLSSVCFHLFPTDVAWDNIFFFCSCRVIALAYCFGKMVPVTAITDAIYLWFGAMENALLHASGLSQEDKIEERIIFALCHARLYLTESYDDWDDKSAASNIFDISCGGRVSVSSTSYLFFCLIFTSARFLPNNSLSSDGMVDWDNYSMLGIGGGDTNID